LRDINSDWCEALCTRYPESIDREFLLEHILGIDLQLNPISLYQAPYDSRRMLKEDIDETTDLFRTMGQMAADMLLIAQEPEGGWSRLAFHRTLRANVAGAGLEAVSAASASWAANNTFQRWDQSDKPDILSPQMSIFIREQLLAIATQIEDLTRKSHGVHVNWWRAPQSGDREYFLPDTHEQFRRTKKGWAKSNAFVSCCRLASNLCE
jgi:hypothetical protein